MNLKRCLLLIIILVITSFCSKKAIPGKNFLDQIEISTLPLQEKVIDNERIIIRNKFGRFTLNPIFSYKISAKVVSATSYGSGWQGEFAPVDLALVWGLLAKNKFSRGIRYSQRNRWYYYNYEYDYPLSKEYIINHSANNHLIPSSYNLRLAIEAIRKGDRVTIDGILINMLGSARGREVYWNSSTRRSDSGDSSCELIYVKSIRINNKLFR